MSGAADSDACVPRALTDFVFDLYDSVTLSQMTEEQSRLYATGFRDLSAKYFANQPWPSPQSIASECNGHPLFLAVYRELTHRHWHAVSRPNIRDRIEGWQVYRELFEEILEADDPNFYLLPAWVFDIVNEFVYQFQGFCQIRSAVYSSARKHGLLQADGKTPTPAAAAGGGGGGGGPGSGLVENLNTLLNSKDAWDAESVFAYLHRLVQMGLPKKKNDSQAGQATASSVSSNNSNSSIIQPVYSFFSVFGSVALSRLECLLGDYTASLRALHPLTEYEDYVIPKDEGSTVTATLQSVFPARLSLAYHAGISYLQLRRYRDASKILGGVCAHMQRGFKTGQLRKIAGSEQFNKQYDRMLSLLAVLTKICPVHDGIEESVLRAAREKHGGKLDAAATYEDWFACPKFVSVDPTHGQYRQQVQLFLTEMDGQRAAQKLRSYLKLYTGLSVDKLASFHDMSTDEFLPLLLSYKIRMRQLERPTQQQQQQQQQSSSGEDGTTTSNGAGATAAAGGGGGGAGAGAAASGTTGSSSTGKKRHDYLSGTWKSALDIHFYLEKNHVYIDEAEKQRRFENYFVAQIAQNNEIRRDVAAIDTSI